MKNFLRHNYGVVIGVALGLFTPLSALLFGVIGVIYDNKPEWLGLKNQKPKTDAWVNRMLEGKQDHHSIR